MTSDCLICYDYQATNGRMIFLECLHGLCQSCLYKLQKSVCPFCRTVIKKDVYTQVSNNDKKQVSNEVEVVRNEVIVPISYPRVIRVRVRRHRRIRSIDTDIIDSDYGVVNIESPIQIAIREKYREKRKRNKQDNKKKGRYSQSNYRNRQRYRYV